MFEIENHLIQISKRICDKILIVKKGSILELDHNSIHRISELKFMEETIIIN